MTDAPPAAPARPAAILPALALDGLSGAGKSSVARTIARDWRWGCLDTGASYRAVTVAALAAGVVTAGQDTVSGAAAGGLIEVAGQALRTLQLPLDPRASIIRLGDRDVSAAIRDDATTATVSAVSAVPGVRQLLVGWQRATVLEAVRTLGGCVCEGRDIGGVVLPDAAVKVWLTADTDARAGRRAGETRRGRADAGATLTEVRRSVARRDALDSARAADPALPAPDAYELDTTDLTLAEVVDQVSARLRAAGLTQASARA